MRIGTVNENPVIYFRPGECVRIVYSDVAIYHVRNEAEAREKARMYFKNFKEIRNEEN